MAGVFTTDVGTKIVLDTGEDLTSGVSSVKIVAKPPSGPAVDLSSEVVETTKIQHQKTASTLNTAGEWQLQSHVEYTAGGVYRGVIVKLTVYSPLT